MQKIVSAHGPTFVWGLAAHQELQEHGKILRLGDDQLHIVDAGILEHLRKRDVLAQRALEVEPVAFGGNQLHATAALVEHLKKALGVVDVLNLHSYHSFLPFVI